MSEVFKDYNIEFPFAPAAGAINGRNEDEIRSKVIDVLRSPAWAAKIGSFTYNGGEGNEPEFKTVYYHNSVTGQTANSIGLANIGHKAAVPLYRELNERAEAEFGKPLIPSFSPGKGEDPLEVLPAMASKFAEAGAKIIEVNYSCPNKFESGNLEPVLGFDLDSMFEIDDRIVLEVGDSTIVIIRKLPPPVGEKRVLLPAMAKGFSRTKGRVALGLYNTIGAQKILTELGEPALAVPDNFAGLSGPALIELGRLGIRDFKPKIPETVGIVSSLGVTSGREVYHRTEELGADTAEGVTVLWENELRGKSFGETITRMAHEYSVTAID